jgi:hypothetical protein|tara:strand:+ start:163 stop:810 length:648 start_codon:yes stop_codon:yes gene_type:complete
MITHNDQLELFTLISKNIAKDITCWAFGGNAMMFYGYKEETKDIDLLFEDESSRSKFIEAIEELGFTESSPINVYIPEKLRDKHRPLMFKKEDTRFDLFVNKIFHTVLSPKMKEDIYAMHEFKGKNNLSVSVFRKEHIVMLKGITERQNDFDDIRTIIDKEKTFDWQYFIDEVLWQHKHGDSWVLLDTEKMLKELKKYVFIEEKYLKQLYKQKKK